MEFTVAEIAQAIGGEAVGDGSLVIRGAAEPALAAPDQLAIATNKRFAGALRKGRARAALMWADADPAEYGLEAGIRVTVARYAMAQVTNLFDRLPTLEPGIHPTAIIAADAQIGEDARIGPYVVIGPRVRIGKRAWIGSHVSISDDVQIGDDAILHAGVRIGQGVRIGDRFRCHSNTVIGADGFGFAHADGDAPNRLVPRDEQKTGAPSGRLRIASLASVVIGDDVEMGANCTVDRGTLADTVIGRGTKLDNIVHVGHNVKLGEDVVLCGMVGLGGSTVIGDRSIMGGAACTMDHADIGKDVVIGGATKVRSRIRDGQVILGGIMPAVEAGRFHEIYRAVLKLPNLANKVAELEKRLSKQGDSD